MDDIKITIMNKLELLDTLVLLNFNENTLHFVYVSEEQTRRLVEKYDNDIEAWADAEFAEDIGVDMCNCNWMLVSGKPDIFEHRMVKGKWKEKYIHMV